jgi:broad specificity phosphatase PhoE
MALGARLAAPLTPPSLPVPATAPAAIWHSPLRRAIQTAQAIHEAREADAPLRELDALTELSQGEWEGMTQADVRERYPERLRGWLADPVRHHAPGGESLTDAAARVRSARDTILGAQPLAEDALDRSTGGRVEPAEPVLGYPAGPASTRSGWVIIVAHDGVLRLLTLGLLGIGLERFWSFPFGLASVSVLDLVGGVVRLRAHNLDGHIEALVRR